MHRARLRAKVSAVTTVATAAMLRVLSVAPAAPARHELSARAAAATLGVRVRQRGLAHLTFLWWRVGTAMTRRSPLA